jgi:hypothetical protein
VTPVPLWRVFPWDAKAAEGDPFSASYVPGGQGRSRFDLRGQPRGVIYWAESKEHAVAETIQAFRNSPDPLTNDDLTMWGYRLALVSATLEPGVWPGIADLCEPARLSAISVTADEPARRDRRRTQQIAAQLHSRQHTGLRWWSAFWGEWHTVVLFRDRLPAGALTFDRPTPLDDSSPPVIEAARLLDIG